MLTHDNDDTNGSDSTAKYSGAIVIGCVVLLVAIRILMEQK